MLPKYSLHTIIGVERNVLDTSIMTTLKYVSGFG